MKDPQRIAGYLGLGALVAVVLAPPEAYGSGRMLLVVTATFAFLALSVSREIPTLYLGAGAGAAILLVIHSLWLSVDVYRSLEFLGLAWAYYCLFGVFRYSRVDLRYRTSILLVLLASGAALYGIYQYLWGFGKLYEFVAASQATDAVRSPILSQLDSARVFSTFALPGTFWGFLILTIPLHAVVWTSGVRWRQVGAALNIGLILTASALTQSYGFVLGLLVVLAGWGLTRARFQWTRTALAALVAIPFAGGCLVLVYLTRTVSHNPVLLRLQNWLSAWEIFSAHPLGSGLNTYAVLYLQHQQPGANETQFAHNTPLQLLAELGVFGLVVLIPLVFWFGSRLRNTPREGIERWLFLALVVWITHNLMDINVYFGSIGAVGAVLAGMLMWTPAPKAQVDRNNWRRLVGGLTGGLAVLAILSSGAIYVSGEFLFRARAELEFQRIDEARATLRTAALINPFDSSIMHEAGQTELELFHTTGDREHLRASRDYFSRAIRLSPRKVGPRIGLALTSSSAGKVGEALRELEIAQSLHPASTQASNIRRLIEQRQAEDLARQSAGIHGEQR